MDQKENHIHQKAPETKSHSAKRTRNKITLAKERETNYIQPKEPAECDFVSGSFS